MRFEKLKNIVYFDTYGNIASSAFIIALISGIVLAVPYNITSPYQSLSELILLNPYASLIRGVHYWSAQIFLIFSVLHIWEHFKKGTEKKLKRAVWLRLVISLFFILFVMLSGFLLKNDMDSNQAFLILESLFRKIPVVGEYLSKILIGNNDNLQIVYVNHIATASIFLAIIILEHAKYLWTKQKSLIIVTIISFILSYFLVPYLHDGISPIIKGPWYFIGFQEILHYFSNPVYVLILIVVLFFVFYKIRFASETNGKYLKQILFYLFWGYLFITIFAFFFRGENWKLRNPLQTENQFLGSVTFNSADSLTNKKFIVRGKVEGCLNCHDGMTGFISSHNPEALGCSSCHLGNPFTLDKTTAHENMINIPGNLDVADITCGRSDCHAEIIPRINSSLMKTNAGLVSVDKFVFNEISLPEGHFDITELKNNSPADSHLRQLCASCHLSNPKEEYGPINELSRGGGCNACHLKYSENALNELMSEKPGNRYHPSLSLEITDEHCFGCHSRSGRISTNYQGWHETQYDSSDIKWPDKNYRLLKDGRVFEFVNEDIHHKKGLGCIDCHLPKEVMGDGNFYMHAEEQTKLKCENCHTDKPEIVKVSEVDDESKKIIKLKDYKSTEFLAVSNDKIPLLNSIIRNDSLFLISKLSRELHYIKKPSDVCLKGKAHDNLTCNSCHTSWSPQCIGCHTEFVESENGFDHLTKEEVKGSWEEHVGIFLPEEPTLGVKEMGDKKKIETFIPGMVLTVNRGDNEGNEIFKRLFSPTISHTISSKGRDCKSCHNNPLAIGYGRGELKLIKKSSNTWAWSFIPKYAANKNDGLPEDAWIGFLSESTNLKSTRTKARPFNLKEQKNILTVGACLTCHSDKEKITNNFLSNFEKSIKKRSEVCILPVF